MSDEGRVRGPRSLVHAVLFNAVSSVGVLGINFCTGVIVARLLHASGRGEVVSLMTLSQMAGWLAGLGINEGVTYLAAKRPKDASRIFGTSLVLAVILGAIGTLLAQLVLPYVLNAQSPELVATGRIYVFGIFLGLLSSQLLANVLGSQDFTGVAIAQFLQPAIYLVGLVSLALTDTLSVGTVLAVSLSSSAVTSLWLGLRLRRRVPLGHPSLEIGRAAASYGLRVQGTLLGSVATYRLDLLIMPAFLAASAVGVYSVATNTSAILIALIGALSQVVLPAAARRGGRAGALLVARSLRLALAVGFAAALPMAVLAPELLSLVYGHDFVRASTSLRILLPGMVFAMGANVIESGLQAAGRPLAASAGQLFGLVVTVVGLALVLHPFGIVGAASVTTAAYFSAFLISLVLIHRDPYFSIRTAFSPRGVRDDLRSMVGVVHRLWRPAASARGDGPPGPATREDVP